MNKNNKKEEQKVNKPVNKPINKPIIKTLEKLESGVYKHPDGNLLYEPDDEFTVKSCCGSMCNVDKPFMEFLAKTTVSLSVLAFCFVQLSQSKQSEFASSTISLILGTYLGSTVANNVKQNNNK